MATADDITVAFDGSDYVVTDSTATIPAANVQGCEPPSGSAVRCPDGVQFILVDAEGGPDTVHIEASVPANVQVRINGGTGADALYGGPGNDILEAGDDSDPDLLDGGPGDDGLIGARTDTPTPFDSGKSTLIGGEGSDLLVGGDPCNGDTFDGGPGTDTASFVRFNPGVTAEIGGAVTRAGGGCTAGHIYPSIESVEGSAGPDTLIGDNRANTLIGHAGDDTLIGGGGQDSLIGGAGNDRLVGGPGRDGEHQ